MLLQATYNPVEFGCVFYSHRLSDVRGRKEEKQRDSATGAPNVVFREKETLYEPVSSMLISGPAGHPLSLVSRSAIIK